MADASVSQMTQVAYKSTLLIPAIDMTAPAGEKNVVIQAGEIPGSGASGSGTGTAIWTGSAIPAQDIGANGDFYFQILDGQVTLFGPKYGGAWPAAGVSLQGSTGPVGPGVLSGSAAPTDTLGEDGDLYVQLSGDSVSFYGARSGGIWPPPVILATSEEVTNAVAAEATARVAGDLPTVANVGLTVTQPPSGFLFQRSVTAGGSYNLGYGAVSIAVELNFPAKYMEYRLRDGSTSGNPTLQDWTLLVYSVAPGQQTLTIPNVSARLGSYLIDLRPNGDDTQIVLGTSPISVGRRIYVSGQSEIAGMVNSAWGDTTTLAELGITPSPYGVVYGAFNSMPSGTSYEAVGWAPPADGTLINSAGCAQFLNNQIRGSGVSCAVIVNGYGGQSITTFISGGAGFTEYQTIFGAIGYAYEAMCWFQGATDGANSMSYATYYANLTTLFAKLKADNTFGLFPIVMSTIQGTNRAGSYTAQQMLPIEKAQYDWCQANGATWVPQIDCNVMSSGTHVDVEMTQAGEVTTANNFHRALRPSMGLPGVGDQGPTMSAGTYNGSVITIPVTQAGGTNLVGVGSWWTRFFVFPKGTLTGQLAVSSGTLSATAITLTMSAALTGPVDVYWAQTPSGQDNNASVMVYDNNTADSDNFANGRPLEPNTAPLTFYSAVPTISINTPYPVVGLPLVLTGIYAGGAGNSYAPTGISYQENGTGAFTALTNFSAANGVWIGTGPTYSAAATGQTLVVEDATTTSITATSPTFSVVTETAATAITLTNPTYDSTTPKFGADALSGGYGTLPFSELPALPYTIECWAKTTAAGSVTVAVFGGAAIGWVGMQSSGALTGSDSSGSTLANSVLINDGKWHHLALVQTTSGSSLYCDGVLAASTTNKLSLPSAALIGVNIYCSGTSPYTPTANTNWTGEIDELAIFSGARYSGNFTPPVAPYTGAEPNCVGVWHLDGNGNGTT